MSVGVMTVGVMSVGELLSEFILSSNDCRSNETTPKIADYKIYFEGTKNKQTQ